MMRIVIILLSCLSVLFSSCADSKIVAQKKVTELQQSFVFSGDKSPEIDCITLRYPCQLYYTVLPPGSAPKMTYTFSEEEKGVFDIVCKKGDLRIEINNPRIKNIGSPKLKVYLSAPPVERIEMSASSSIKVTGDFTSSKSLRVDMTGASDLNFNDIVLENGAKFELIGTGASSVKIKNMICRAAAIGLTGASELDCAGMDIPALTIDCSGASEMDINVNNESLLLTCSGASEVRVKGKAGKAVLSASGASEISAKGLVAATYNINESGGSSVSGLDRKQKDRNGGGTKLEIRLDENSVPIP